MPKPIVIYMPYGSGCTPEQEAIILRRYPNCQFSTVWVDGAIMWQDAAK